MTKPRARVDDLAIYLCGRRHSNVQKMWEVRAGIPDMCPDCRAYAALFVDYLTRLAALRPFAEMLARAWAGDSWEHRLPMKRKADTTAAGHWMQALAKVFRSA